MIGKKAKQDSPSTLYARMSYLYIISGYLFRCYTTKQRYIKIVLFFDGANIRVFEVKNWYPKKRLKNKTIDKERKIKIQVEVIGRGFDGVVAPDEIRNLYINKSVAHIKQKGAAQVIRYNL